MQLWSANVHAPPPNQDLPREYGHSVHANDKIVDDSETLFLIVQGQHHTLASLRFEARHAFHHTVKHPPLQLNHEDFED